MNKRSITIAMTVLALTAASAWADCQKKINLVPTGAGISKDISGTAVVRAAGTVQKFKVSMDAAVRNGAIFVVRANGQLAGAITIQLGSGELDLNTKDGDRLPPGVNPVCSISTVSVSTPAGITVLNGSF